MSLSWGQIGILLVSRLIMTTAFRVLYPLLPFLAAGWQVELDTVSLLITVQLGAQFASLWGGMLADSRGERLTMQVGLAVFCAGTLVCALAGGLGLFLAGYVLVGLGTALYHPAMQGYASHHSSYAQRGRMLGVLELSWALSAIVGVTPLVFLVTYSGGWWAAFLLLLVLGLAALVATRYGLPESAPAPAVGRPAARMSGQLAVLRQPAVLALLVFLLLVMAGFETMYVAVSDWLVQDFRATQAQIGLLFGLLGVLELGGSLLSALLTDRLGKRRTVLVGFALAALLQAVLPWSAGSWLLFLPLFLLHALLMEFAIVSAVTLSSVVSAQARGTVLALSVAARGLGRMSGSLLGPLVWLQVGFGVNGVLGALLMLVGVLVCALAVHEGERARLVEPGS